MKINLPEPLLEEHGKRAVVLLHAYSGSPNDVRMLFRFLERANYTVYAPMLKGHGTLDPQDIVKEKIADWYDQSRQALNLMKQKGYSEIAVLGLSLGGVLALANLTEQDPRIIGGGCFCSPLFKGKTNVAQSFQEYARKTLQSTDLSDQEIETKMIEIQAEAAKQQLEIEKFAEKTSQKLDSIQLPVFLAQAGQDKMIDAQTVFLTAEALEKTKITLQWYPKSGHVVTVGPEKREFEKDVLAFLNHLPWNEDQ